MPVEITQNVVSVIEITAPGPQGPRGLPGDLGTERVVTTAGTVTVGAAEGSIVLNKAAPSSTAVHLPAVASRAGLPFHIADFAGNGGDVTITPNGAETIMSQASWVIANGGWLVLYPSVAISGWTL